MFWHSARLVLHYKIFGYEHIGANFLSLPAFSADEIFRETFESDEEKIISFDRFNVSAIQILSLIVCKIANNISYKSRQTLFLHQILLFRN